MTKRQLNIVFGATVVILGITAVYFMLENLRRPTIVRDLRSQTAGSNLPENHPPIDLAAQLTTLDELSRENPQEARYKTQIGNVYYDMGRFEDAAKAYRESLELEPENPSVETDLATSYHYLGQHDRALDTLNKVLAYRPHFPQALFNKGVVLQMGKQDVAAAVAVWEELLETNPDYPMREELERKIRDLKSPVKD